MLRSLVGSEMCIRDRDVRKERCQGYAQQQEGRGGGVRPVPGAVRAGGGGLEDPGHAASSTTYGSRPVTHRHDQGTPDEPHPRLTASPPTGWREAREPGAASRARPPVETTRSLPGTCTKVPEE